MPSNLNSSIEDGKSSNDRQPNKLADWDALICRVNLRRVVFNLIFHLQGLIMLYERSKSFAIFPAITRHGVETSGNN